MTHAEKNFRCEQGLALYCDEFNIGHQSWFNGIGYQAAQPFFLVQGLINANDFFLVINPKNKPPACGIGKSHQSLKEVPGRGKIFFELQGLAFRRLKDMFNG